MFRSLVCYTNRWTVEIELKLPNEINNHRLEVFTLVSEIFDNVDMVLGIKNLFKLEGVIDSGVVKF